MADNMSVEEPAERVPQDVIDQARRDIDEFQQRANELDQEFQEIRETRATQDGITQGLVRDIQVDLDEGRQTQAQIRKEMEELEAARADRDEVRQTQARIRKEMEEIEAARAKPPFDERSFGRMVLLSYMLVVLTGIIFWTCDDMRDVVRPVLWSLIAFTNALVFSFICLGRLEAFQPLRISRWLAIVLLVGVHIVGPLLLLIEFVSYLWAEVRYGRALEWLIDANGRLL